MEKFAAVPQNFGRVELYAGTPLLASMQAQGRCTGDYLDWDYRIADKDAQRVFELAMQCFYVRNFSDVAAANLLMGTRFVVEVAARFHPQIFRESWMTEAKRLNRELAGDSVQGMREIMKFVQAHKSRRRESDFVWRLSERLRATERRVMEAAGRLETEIQNVVGGPNECTGAAKQSENSHSNVACARSALEFGSSSYRLPPEVHTRMMQTRPQEKR